MKARLLPLLAARYATRLTPCHTPCKYWLLHEAAWLARRRCHSAICAWLLRHAIRAARACWRYAIAIVARRRVAAGCCQRQHTYASARLLHITVTYASSMALMAKGVRHAGAKRRRRRAPPHAAAYVS